MADRARGAVGDEDFLDLLHLPTVGQWYDLGMTLDNDRSAWPGHGPFVHYTFMSYAQGGKMISGGQAPGVVGMLTDRVEMPLHAGTHIDALNHFSINGRLNDGSDAADSHEVGGTSVLGVDTVMPFVCRGVLLNIPAVRGVERLEDDAEITGADLMLALEKQKIQTIPKGGVVLIYTGWMQLYAVDRRRYFNSEPGLGMGATEVLRAAGVRGVGADNHALERVTTLGSRHSYPVHQALLVQSGIHIFENLVLGQLASAGIGQFLFIAIPLKIRGATASPIRPLAIV